MKKLTLLLILRMWKVWKFLQNQIKVKTHDYSEYCFTLKV